MLSINRFNTGPTATEKKNKLCMHANDIYRKINALFVKCVWLISTIGFFFYYFFEKQRLELIEQLMHNMILNTISTLFTMLNS